MSEIDWSDPDLIIKEKKKDEIDWSDPNLGLTTKAGPEEPQVVESHLTRQDPPGFFKSPLVVNPAHGRGTEGADLFTQFKTGFVDDPQTKMEIYAKDRFPDEPKEERLKRYKIQGNSVIYKDDDGKWKRESTKGLSSKAKRFFGETAAHSPAIALGTAGEVLGGPLGPVAAGLGAAGGEGFRKVIGATVFDEPQTTTGNIVDMGLEGLTGLIAGTGSTLTTRGINRVGTIPGGRTGSRVTKAAGRDADFIDWKKAKQDRDFYKAKFGVELFDAQTSGSRKLIDRINLYGDLPDSADLVDAAVKIQDEQAFKATTKFFDDIAEEISPLSGGKQMKETTENILENMEIARTAKASPIYQEAFRTAPNIDISPVVKNIQSLINRMPDGKSKSSLQSIKKLFTEEIEEKIGKKIVKRRVPISNLEKIDFAKNELDDFIRGTSVESQKVSPSTKKKLNKALSKFKTDILTITDKASPTYAEARKTFADLSPAIDELKIGKIGELAGLRNEKTIEKAARKLFSFTESSPDMMLKAKKLIQKDNPELWDKSLRVFLEDVFNNVKGSTGGRADKIFNNFWRNTVGHKKQKNILKAAMSERQFRNLEDFAEALRKIGLIARKESTTATRQVSLGTVKQEGKSNLLTAMSRPLVTFTKRPVDKINEMLSEIDSRKMAEALLNLDATKHLVKIKRMGPKTTRGLRATLTFLGMVSAGEFGTNLTRSDKKH